MKRILSLSVLLFCLTTNAQKVDCTVQTKEYQDFLAEKNPEEAFSAWEFVAKNCPKQNATLYTDGISIFQYKIDQSSAEDKEKAVRELMKLYDKFYLNFPENTQDFEIKKAMLLIDNRIDAKDDELFMLFENGFAKAANSVKDANIIYNYFRNYHKKYTTEKSNITADNYIDKYLQLERLLKKISAENENRIDEYNAALRALKAEAKQVINCENLSAYYEKNNISNAENLQWFDGILELMQQHCSNNPIFLTAAEKYYNKIQTSKSAGYLAFASLRNRKLDNAKKHYEASANLETNPIEKAQIYFTTAISLYSTDLVKTKELLNNAITLNPKFTTAYIYLSQVYANNAEQCGKTDFEKKAIVYLAIQTAKKALAHDSKSEKMVESIVNKLSEKSLTDNDLKNGKWFGKTYKIECNINETITFPRKK